MKKQKFRARKGATFIEYALLAGLVAIVVAAAAMFFGDDLKELFGSAGQQTEKVKAAVDNVNLTTTLEKANDKSGGGGEQGK